MRLVIRRSKEKAWRDLMDTIEKYPWGIPYKICMYKLMPRSRYHASTLRRR